MFGALLNWWRELWRTRDKRANRFLFELFDGRRFVKRDPWAIYRQLYNDEEFVPSQMLAAAMDLEEPEFSKCIRCCHRAFGTQPFDGASSTGVTDQEALNILVEYFDYLDALAKKNGGLQMPSPPTGSTSATGPECQAETTKPHSPSSCSTDESPTAAPSPS